ncbi:acyl-CoA Delta(11) desaturase isoform X2 [Cephus cinctus]|uniref:Acyl-CoA Delta(11) desaturase isoform X2 n=1 Tax=Cephus cinctus TaxID=211228 RepID=A0AAJ7BMH5_CEPCN|nr:acyl-CoA Delta(11) desaturase isoform X2 [Cephus cinctus]
MKSREPAVKMAPNISGENRCVDSKFEVQPNELVELPEKILETEKTEGVLPVKETKGEGWFSFKTELIWLNIIAISLVHLIAFYGILTFPVFECKLTLLWGTLLGQLAGFGVTGGVHRLWTHRSYKAKLPLRIILLVCYAMAGQNTIYDWVRDHRVHHKFSETDADPHNSNRGFFFAHVGWLMMRKHPEVIRRGRQVDMSDILADPVVVFGEKYFLPLKLFFCFIFPTLLPIYCWNETWYRSIMAQVFVRYILTLNFTWCVNSAAHLWGTKPYDNKIQPAENLGVALVALGEGWHNYHHVFPWDYKAAELGNYRVNTTTMLIDMFAKIGWAYDLKQPSKDLVKRIVEKKGDGSHPLWGEVPEPKAE